MRPVPRLALVAKEFRRCSRLRRASLLTSTFSPPVIENNITLLARTGAVGARNGAATHPLMVFFALTPPRGTELVCFTQTLAFGASLFAHHRRRPLARRARDPNFLAALCICSAGSGGGLGARCLGAGLGFRVETFGSPGVPVPVVVFGAL